MHVLPLWGRSSVLIGLLLLSPLEFSGSGENSRERRALADDCSCGNITIKVDHTKLKGVDHKAVYLCPTYTITFVSGPHVRTFEVVFDDPPFGGATTFNDSNPTTPPLPDPGELTVFKYHIKIVDDNGVTHRFDPHVVGGGGH
jgi:hypothetical protein